MGGSLASRALGSPREVFSPPAFAAPWEALSPLVLSIFRLLLSGRLPCLHDWHQALVLAASSAMPRCPRRLASASRASPSVRFCWVRPAPWEALSPHLPSALPAWGCPSSSATPRVRMLLLGSCLVVLELVAVSAHSPLLPPKGSPGEVSHLLFLGGSPPRLPGRLSYYKASDG